MNSVRPKNGSDQGEGILGVKHIYRKQRPEKRQQYKKLNNHKEGNSMPRKKTYLQLVNLTLQPGLLS